MFKAKVFRRVKIFSFTKNFLDFHAGTIFIANCQTQVVDSGEPDPRQKGSGKYTNILSEEEVDDDSSQDDSDFDEFDHRRQHHEQSKRSQKKIKQKNIKQKVVALLKKFRVPEEVGNVIVSVILIFICFVAKGSA